MNQESFAATETSSLKHIRPNGEACLWKSSSLDKIQAGRNRQALRSWSNAKFGIAPSGQKSTHSVAHSEFCDIFTNGGNDSSGFQSKNVRGSRRRRIVALALQQVGAIDSRSHDSN